MLDGVRVVAPPLVPIGRSHLRGELWALTLVDPSRQWTIDELSARTAQPYQTVATEVRRLTEAELLSVTPVGHTKLLTANRPTPTADLSPDWRSWHSGLPW